MTYRFVNIFTHCTTLLGNIIGRANINKIILVLTVYLYWFLSGIRRNMEVSIATLKKQ